MVPRLLPEEGCPRQWAGWWEPTRVGAPAQQAVWWKPETEFTALRFA